MQEKLDSVLLPFGILSHHLRRVKAENIDRMSVPVSDDEYVVYRLVSSNGKCYGDGNAHCMRYYIDVNYYYSYEKTDARFADAERRIHAIIREILRDRRFRLANGQSDIYDFDNPYRGINVEFLFLGVIDDGENWVE